MEDLKVCVKDLLRGEIPKLITYLGLKTEVNPYSEWKVSRFDNTKIIFSSADDLANIEFEFSLYSNNILSVDSYIEYRYNIYEPFFREEGEMLSLDLKRGEAFIPRKYEALYNSIKLLSKTNFDMLAYTIFEKIDFSDVDFLKAIDCFNNKLKEHTLKYCKKVGLDTNNDSKVFEVIDRMYGVRIGGLSDDDAYIISEFLINHLFYSYNKEDELIDYITSLNK